jgi:hypothetical protein
VYVHFFPDDEVREVVTMWVGASPNDPTADMRAARAKRRSSRS